MSGAYAPRTIALQEKNAARLESIWETLRDFLDARGQSELYPPLQHVIRELVFNGLKANLKRVFLEERGAGEPLPEFRAVLEVMPPELAERLRASGRAVEVQFAPGPDGDFTVEVANDCAMLPEEREAVEALLFGPPGGHEDEASGEATRGREGGGLGLRMARKILENSGLGVGRLAYSSAEGRTSFRLRVPLQIP